MNVISEPEKKEKSKSAAPEKVTESIKPFEVSEREFTKTPTKKDEIDSKGCDTDSACKL